MSATSRRRAARGMVMILVLVLVSLLLIVALAIVAGSNSAVESATAVSIKYRVLNAAEGAANVALNDLAANPGEANGTHIGGSLNGVPYDAYVRFNNLLGPTGTMWTDPATGNQITVPGNSAYLYGVAADRGGHTTYVEAIVQPASPLTLPPGAVNAGGDILDLSPMAISADPADPGNPADADIHANGAILVQGQPSVVQGRTYAVGEDDLPGSDGLTHGGSGPTRFPNAAQIAEAARTALLSARSGMQLTGSEIAQRGTQSYGGDVYVSGDVRLAQGTVTFNGPYVYVDGDLCLGADAHVVNARQSASEVVVAGTVEITGNASFAAMPRANALLLALGQDASAAPCSEANAHAVDLFASGAAAIGTIFAPNGSISLTGPGSIAGALDSGIDARIDGTDQAVGMRYDSAQASTTMSTGALTFSSYIEY